MICNAQGTVLCNITPDKSGFNYVYFMANAQLTLVIDEQQAITFFPPFFYFLELHSLLCVTCLALPPNLQHESIIGYQKLLLPFCHAPVHSTVV